MDTNDLVKLLPPGYEQACFDKKAVTRKRTIKNPLDLLRLILFYLSGNKSLIDVTHFALLSGIGKISDAAFMKKFIQCGDWIKWLTQNILPNPIMHYKKPGWLESYQVLAVDASDLVEKGAVKRLWHLHYAADLFSLACSQFKITEQSTGESLKNFTFSKGCLVTADRAYGTIKSIGHCLDAGAGFILRIKNKAFNMHDRSGQKIILADWLLTAGEKAAECTVYINGSDKKRTALRLCAIKKTKEEIRAEEKRLKKLESKKQKTYSEETKFTHRYMFVITSLPAPERRLHGFSLRPAHHGVSAQRLPPEVRAGGGGGKPEPLHRLVRPGDVHPLRGRSRGRRGGVPGGLALHLLHHGLSRQRRAAPSPRPGGGGARPHLHGGHPGL